MDVRDRSSLERIVEHASMAIAYARTTPDWRHDQKTVDAIVARVGQVGENATLSRLSEDAQAAVPGVGGVDEEGHIGLDRDRGSRPPDSGQWLDRPYDYGYKGHMRTSSVTKAKNGLSALIDQVRAGETILLLDRGHPVARLEPVAGHEDRTGRIARLERAGVLRVGTAQPPVDLLRQPAPELSPGASAVQALLEERASSR